MGSGREAAEVCLFSGYFLRREGNFFGNNINSWILITLYIWEDTSFLCRLYSKYLSTFYEIYGLKISFKNRCTVSYGSSIFLLVLNSKASSLKCLIFFVSVFESMCSEYAFCFEKENWNNFLLPNFYCLMMKIITVKTEHKFDYCNEKFPLLEVLDMGQ